MNLTGVSIKREYGPQVVLGLETMNLTGVSIVKTHTCNPLYVLYFKNTLHVIHEIHFHNRHKLFSLVL